MLEWFFAIRYLLSNIRPTKSQPYGHTYMYTNLNFFANFMFLYVNHRPYGYISSHKLEGQICDIRLWAKITHIIVLHSWVKLELVWEWSSFWGKCIRMVDTHTHTWNAIYQIFYLAQQIIWKVFLTFSMKVLYINCFKNWGPKLIGIFKTTFLKLMYLYDSFSQNIFLHMYVEL